MIFPSTRRATLAPTSLLAAFTVVMIAACNGPSAVPSATDALLAQHAAKIPKPSQTPYQFSFTTLDNPSNTSFNQITGVDELGQVVGNYGNGSKSDPSNGYTSLSPYTTFKIIDYPSAISTTLTSINSGGKIFAGYFVDNANDYTTWGFIRNHGIWSQYKDFGTPRGHNSINELLGINDAGIAVGFYVNSSGDDVPYELAINHFTNFKPPGFVSATATGINQRGDVTGSETLASKATEGWLLRGGVYSQFTYPGSTMTEALSLNYQEQVVGAYVDGKGTHGFILTNPGSPNGKFWQSIDEPNAAGTTEITGISGHHTITGWYVDSDGNTNGFVATLRQ